MIEIRDYRDDDYGRCRALWVALTEHHRVIYETPTIGGDDPGEGFDRHLAAVGPSNLWVAEIDGAVVGLTGLIPGEGEGELEPLIVDEAHRGEGVGRALTERVIAECRERGYLSISVRPVARNATALAAFHSLGFTTVGHVELFQHLRGDRTWRPGADIGEIAFDV